MKKIKYIVFGVFSLLTMVTTSCSNFLEEEPLDLKTDGQFWTSDADAQSAVNMVYMFAQATAFNQNISNWNISKATDMNNMFNIATAFNQDLSAWCAKFNINVNLANFLDNSGMSAANYSAFLNALWADIGTTRQGTWIARTVAKILGAANLKYNSTAAAARASLIANGWTITDGGLAA
jgi:surface protein